MRLIVITGTCGAGKSTLRNSLPGMLDPERYACVDSDEVGLNWWDYAGTDREEKYGEDTLKRAAGMAEGKDLVFVSCLNPQDYFARAAAPEEITATFFIFITSVKTKNCNLTVAVIFYLCLVCVRAGIIECAKAKR